MKSAELLVSVVVPAYNRPDALARCLDALTHQTLPPSAVEIVVVDDGSTPPLAPALPSNARIVRQPNAGPAAARNRGAAVARGRFLAFTDDDCAPEPNWLEALVEALQVHQDALVGGITRNALTQNVFSQASQDVVTFLQQRGEVSGHAFVASNNIALSAEAFARAGGFDTRYRGAGGEDRAFCRTWLQLGHSIQTVWAARVQHHHALTLRAFWHQHKAYGRGARRFHGAAGGRPKPLRQSAFYANLLATPFRAADSRNAPVRSLLLGLAQVATAWGYARPG
jgi:glycosyltransferase involved in cell wall biosynthesis